MTRGDCTPTGYFGLHSGGHSMSNRIEPIYREIARRIVERRLAVNMRQEDLAMRVGMSRPALANIETGRQRILIHHLYALAEVLGCTPGDLAPKPRVAAKRDWLLPPTKRTVWSRSPVMDEEETA